jgi:hypothetical protein
MPGFCLNSGLDSLASASRSILHGNGVACGVYKQGGGEMLLIENNCSFTVV